MINLNLKEEGVKEIKYTLDSGKIVTFSMRDSVLQDVDVVAPLNDDNTEKNKSITCDDIDEKLEKILDDYTQWVAKFKDKNRETPLSMDEFKTLFLSRNGIWKNSTNTSTNKHGTLTSLSKNGDIRNTLEAARTGEWKENVKATGSFVPKPEPRDGKPINRTPTAASDEEINDFKESQKESDEYRWDKIKKSIEKEEDGKNNYN